MDHVVWEFIQSSSELIEREDNVKPCDALLSRFVRVRFVRLAHHRPAVSCPSVCPFYDISLERYFGRAERRLGWVTLSHIILACFSLY